MGRRQASSGLELTGSHCILRPTEGPTLNSQTVGQYISSGYSLKSIMLSCVRTSKCKQGPADSCFKQDVAGESVASCLVISEKGSRSCTFWSILSPGSTFKTWFVLYNRDVVTGDLHLSGERKWISLSTVTCKQTPPASCH